LIWPSDFWKSINPAQQKLAEELVVDLGKSLGVQREMTSFYEEWSRAPPTEAASESLDDFMQNVSRIFESNDELGG
jgi:hypothetical protein